MAREFGNEVTSTHLPLIPPVKGEEIQEVAAFSLRGKCLGLIYVLQVP
jgi:hypothetical protein